jgi:hypothetical protein
MVFKQRREDVSGIVISPFRGLPPAQFPDNGIPGIAEDFSLPGLPQNGGDYSPLRKLHLRNSIIFLGKREE